MAIVISRTGPDTSAADLIDSGYAWMRLAVSMMIGTIGSIGFWGVVVILPAVQAEFAVDRADASIPYTLTMVGFGIGNVLFGRYVDRLGIVTPALAASLAMALGFAGAAFAPNIWIFALLQGVFIGVGMAATFGPLIADVSHWFRRRRGVADGYMGLAYRVSRGCRGCYLDHGAACFPAALSTPEGRPVGHGGGA